MYVIQGTPSERKEITVCVWTEVIDEKICHLSLDWEELRRHSEFWSWGEWAECVSVIHLACSSSVEPVSYVLLACRARGCIYLVEKILLSPPSHWVNSLKTWYIVFCMSLYIFIVKLQEDLCTMNLSSYFDVVLIAESLTCLLSPRVCVPTPFPIII